MAKADALSQQEDHAIEIEDNKGILCIYSTGTDLCRVNMNHRCGRPHSGSDPRIHQGT